MRHAYIVGMAEDHCAEGAHAWQLVPVAEGENPLAIATCCGVKAEKRWGEWMLIDPPPEADPQA
nr:hypothetical protein [uncultured Sphingomonas sp.]